MRYYRLYFLDALTGRIRRFAEFEARDDDEALILAAETSSDQPFELWCADRRVEKAPPAAEARNLPNAFQVNQLPS